MTETTDLPIWARSEEDIARAIPVLKEQLRDRNGLTRLAARTTLIELGPRGLPTLIEALDSPYPEPRWEAAKAFKENPHPQAVDALVRRLRDQDGIRWLASEALEEVGEAAFVPLLRELLDHADSPRLQSAARQILHALQRQHPDNLRIGKVLAALNGPAVPETLPWAVRSVLKEMGLIANAE